MIRLQSAHRARSPDEDAGERNRGIALHSSVLAWLPTEHDPGTLSSSSAPLSLLLKLSLFRRSTRTGIKQERNEERERRGGGGLNVFREWNVTVDKHHKLLHIYYVQQFD